MTTIMQVQIPSSELVNITDLHVDAQNPNRMTRQQHEALRQSIERYGFIVPIITNKDLLIADGEQRWTVAKSMGMAQVPVIRLPIEDVDRRLLRQVLNKLRGEHELIADAHEFDLIINAGHEQDLKDLLLLNDSQIERYLTQIHEPTEETYEIPEIEKITTSIQRGDVYLLGRHRLMCGDATNKQDIDILCDKKVDMILTDPPYRLQTATFGSTKQQYAQTPSDQIPTYDKWLPIVATACNDNASLYIFENFRNTAKLWDELSKVAHPRNIIIWHTINRHYEYLKPLEYPNMYDPILYATIGKPPLHRDVAYSDVVQHPVQNRVSSSTTVKFGGKPLDVLRPVLLASTEHDQVVMDPYGGSGSTLIACEETGRTCYMMEIESRYCQIIINRWEAYTHQKAEKLTESDKIDVATNSN